MFYFPILKGEVTWNPSWVKGGSAELVLEERNIFLEEEEKEVLNKASDKFENYSNLTPLTDSQTAKQVNMILVKERTPTWSVPCQTKTIGVTFLLVRKYGSRPRWRSLRPWQPVSSLGVKVTPVS